MRKDFLRATLAQESRAYGFTIAFWGSGAMLIGAHGLPTLQEALLYGAGAVLGFGLLAVWAYSKTLGMIEEQQDNNLLVISMFHYVGSLAPIALAYYLAKLPPYQAFFTTGIVVSVGYNLGMVVEELLSEEAEILERKFIGS